MDDTIREESSRQKVYRHVKGGIVSHSLKPGDMIHERDIAKELGVSRTPVREALQALQDDGWLTVIPRKGTMVRPMSRAEIQEVLQLRVIIASAGITLSTGRIGRNDFAYLKTFIKRQEEAVAAKDPRKYMEADMAMHHALVQLGGSRRLTVFAENLLGHFQRIGNETLKTAQDMANSLAGHKAILAALEKGETEEARRLMTEHIERARKLLK